MGNWSLSAEWGRAEDIGVPPTRIIDLRDTPIACAVCGESLAIYEFNGDPSTLVCAECSDVGAGIAVAASG
jgi:hypothetical protein